MAASCSSLRRCAANPADSTSRLMRNSRIASTSRKVTTVAGSMRKPLGLGVSSTKVPMPWRVSTWPAACKREIASRTTVRLTPWASMIADSVGQFIAALEQTVANLLGQHRHQLLRQAAALAGKAGYVDRVFHCVCVSASG